MSERNQSKASESSNKIPLHKVLEEELDYLDLFSKKRPQKNDDNKAEKKQVSKQGSEQKGKQPENTSQEENELSNIYKRIHIQASNRSALCLSGGGIRSATFSLGVIQGLAHRGLLDKFDYLSTVSGGGYIGSWLTAWAHRHPEGLGGVAKDLTNTKKSNLDPKPDPVNNLRSYSNYLTPKLGIMSADIWTLIAIYLRNLFLNWLAFIPLLLAALIIPRFCVAVILSQPPKWIINSFLIVGAIAVVITIYYIGINCPSNNEGNKGQPHFMRWCLLPLTLSAISFTIFWAWYPKENNLSILYFIGFGALLHFIGWLAYSIILLCSKKETVPFFISKRLRAVVEFITVLATGAAGGLFAWLMATYLFPDIKLFAGHYVCFAAPSFLGLFLIAGVLLVAFMGYHFEDRDLEWLARSGAWVLIAITIWSAGSSLVIFGPVGLSKLWEEAPTLIASVGGISGIITLFFSFSSKTSFGKKEKENNGLISLLMNNALIISASIFIIFLIAALSLGTDPIVRLVNNKLLTKISQTKTIDQSDFWAGEFKSEATIEKLCNTINDDFKDSFTPISSSDTTESINGLKDLLEHSDFYNIVQEKKPDKSFSKEITELVYKTSGYRYKSKLSDDKKSNIKRLNRLLLEEVYPQEIPKSRTYKYLGLIFNTPLITLGGLIFIFVTFVSIMSFCVDINKFSLHSLYRNRLIRAYLGASNLKREPNLFTAFDENDDLKIHELCSPDFRTEEFNQQLTVDKLCSEIDKNFTLYKSPNLLSKLLQKLRGLPSMIIGQKQPSAQSKEPYSIEWLNKILREPNFYDTLKQIKGYRFISLSKLVQKTAGYRTNSTQFSKLENTQKYNIKMLNRLLCEEVYSKITPKIRKENKLFHVVNITNNLVKGKNLAWQERKAAPFTITPLHSGSSSMSFDPDAQQNSNSSSKYKKGCYRSSEVYGGDDKGRGISLGTAITVSGAATSPNMGYHSSPVLSFLMTLFNVRLGLWLGNPADNKTYKNQGPRLAIRPVISEAFGLTDEKNPYIYLSDGGHFENLGLYEMILRRCHFIVLVDASCDKGEKDKDYEFESLGNAIRKIRIDLGVSIVFENNISIYPKNDQGKEGKYCAIGTIKYSEVDTKVDGKKAEDGKLLYIKPTLCGNEPVDVLNYSKTSPKFPHESTGDQWFSESQFESYRALGFHAVNQIVGKSTVTNLYQFFKQAEKYLEPECNNKTSSQK